MYYYHNFETVDASNVLKSVPDGENTGPFKTTDDPEELIPQDIEDLCDEYDATVEILGH